jgi:hypothetical protein
VYHGYRGISEGLRDLHDRFAELQIEVSEFREVGDALEAAGLRE